ncbi:MAG TPA: hypothetical protein VF072_16335 [Thermoleophilaceae bacterium]
MSYVTFARSPATQQLGARLAAAVAAVLIIFVMLAAVLAPEASPGAADTTQPADTGQARFEGFEAGIAAVVAARRPAGPDETRVAAAIAAK